MISLFNKLIKRYLKYRLPRIAYIKQQPHEAQEKVLRTILNTCSQCSYAKRHEITKNPKDFFTNAPLVEYEDIAPLVEQMMLGKSDILVPGTVKWFAKSSGTSNGRSKYIPVSDRYLLHGHYKGSWDNVTIIYNNNPDSRIFAQKNLLMGGSISPFPQNKEIQVGDISGIIINSMPTVGRPFYSPDFKTALLSDWKEKIDIMTVKCSKHEVFSIAGVPTWTTLLFDSILDYTGKSTMREVWPDATYYMHGGISFEPYKTRFYDYFPDDDMHYINMYNASEGYFALQDEIHDDSMLLLLENDVYYEFIKYSNYQKGSNDILSLREVQIGLDYVMVITTTAGLWRYVVGDVIQFTSLSPYKIQITSRVQQYINVFGEEVMVHNTNKAIDITCEKLRCSIKDYTVAPIFIEKGKKGGHEWLIEFEKAPKDIRQFEQELDDALRNLNSDYDAKRYESMALEKLKINVVETNTFNNWLASKGKLGGQSKVPRLRNNRAILEEILKQQ